MYIIGIDPGLTGGIAIIDKRKGTLWAQMPPLIREKGKKDEYDCEKIIDLLVGYPAGTRVYIEQVAAMPGQGVTSMFRFGKGYGIYIGILMALGFDVTYVTPKKWKKAHGLGRDKDESRNLASAIFPQCKDLWKLKKHDGVAESALIAIWNESGEWNEFIPQRPREKSLDFS